jgi:hypothetical protein
MKKDLVYLIIFAVVSFFTFRSCNKEQALKDEIAKKEQDIKRIENNYLAEQDSVKIYKGKNGNLVASISGYEMTQKELEGKYAHLFGKYENEKNKPPKTIIETQIEWREKITDFSITNKQNGKTGKLEFSSDTTYSAGNSRKIQGSFPYTINYFSKRDSSYLEFDSINTYAKIKEGLISMDNSISMSLITGLRKDKKTGQVEIWAETKYPGVTFSKLQGADIVSDEISRKAAKSFRKEFGIGFHFGYGANFSNTLNYGFNVGVGLNYTPRWLQF